MDVASLVTGLYNWLYLKDEQMEKNWFFCILIQIHKKLKADKNFVRWAWSKMGLAVCSWDCKIDFFKNE